jgi:hypothetical protein
VPCLRSPRRVAVKAASSAADQSSSVLVRPHTWLEVKPRSQSRPKMAGGCTARRGAFAASRQVAASAPGLVRGPSRVVLGFTASVAVATFQPAGQGAVRHLRAPRRPWGSVSSRTRCNCCLVHGGSGIRPRESHRRTTGGVTLHIAAAWRTEVTISCRFTTRTLAAHRSPLRHLMPRS